MLCFQSQKKKPLSWLPVGVYSTHITTRPRNSTAYKLYAFYYFYKVILSVSVCNSKIENNKINVQIKKIKHGIVNICTQERSFSLLACYLCLNTDFVGSTSTINISSRYVFSYHPFYFDFHSARIIFDVSSGFYLWNVNRTTT